MMRFEIKGKSFGARKVLGNLVLELRPGEITALLGPSGIGKSTLLRIMANLELDDSAIPQPEHRLGVVFQEPRLLPWKTVEQNIELVDDERGLLRELGIAEARHLYPRQLSLGMARRVSIARALAGYPNLLILDEPFASLDEASAAVARATIAKAAVDPKMATLIVTHDKAEAQILAKRIYLLEGSPALLKRVQ